MTATSTTVGGGSASPATTAQFAFASAAFAGGGVSGGGGMGGATPTGGAPYGTSTKCGDKIVGPTEECDDGDGGSDACTAACQTRDEVAVVNVAKEDAERHLGAGRHPLSGLDKGFASTYVEFKNNEPVIGAGLFDIWGKRQKRITLSTGAFPIEQANPVVAALPGGSYAVAWTDFDADGSDLGIALRSVAADGTLGLLLTANASAEFTQQNPDLLWTGSELIAAWEDFSDPDGGPDIHYRRFDASLTPLDDEQVLADSPLPEVAIALAPFNGNVAGAYREVAEDGSETVVVAADGKTFRVGPVYGGPPEDRPALVGLDATHLLLVFSAVTDPASLDLYTPRLRYSIIDTASPTAPTSQALDPEDDLYSSDQTVAQTSVAAAWSGDGVLLSWRSEARAKDAARDQIWLKYLSYTPELETKLNMTEKETLLPRVCESSTGDQRTPALAPVQLPPSGALAFAWEDYSHSQGATTGDPEIVVHYAPLHPRNPAGLKVVTENWTGANGTAWPAQWSHNATTFTTHPATISANRGQVLWSSGTGTELAYVNDHKAFDVDLVSKVRFNANGAYGGFVARYQETSPPSYIFGRVSTVINDTWTIGAVIDGATPIVIAKGPILSSGTPAALLTIWPPQLDFWMRFQLLTNADGSLTTKMKLWLTDLPEPSTWTMEGTVTAASSAAILNEFGQTPGRFGLFAKQSIAGRSTTFDDFRATFYEGATHGDPTLTPAVTPIPRAAALYRACAGGTCSGAMGCCLQDSDCKSGTSCQATQGQLVGLGSHAKVCSAQHCGNLVLDADEVRVDCGGADCAPCGTCSAAARGDVGYATVACPGGIGDGDCNTNAECLPGLVCGAVDGYRYGFASGIGACVPQHCRDRVKDADELGVDWGGSCGAIQCSDSANGGAEHCTASCPCASGHGDCDYADECQTGLVCGSAKGPQFGIVGDVCVPLHCTNKKLDADETAIDCGGTDCGTACP